MLPNCTLVLQHLPEAILLLDTDGFVTYVNDKAVSLTGYTERELLKKPFSSLENSVAASFTCAFELSEAFKKGRLETEGWKHKKDGTRFWSGTTIGPLYNESGSFDGYCCCLRDLSEKKAEELRLRQNEERFRLMVEGVKDYAIFMLDTTGHILTWNEGAKSTKGYSSQEIIGRHFSTFYTATDLEDKKPERELTIAIATGKYEEEGWRVKKNGSVFWANVVITALFNENNQHVGFSKVTRDLSERKENEEQLRLSEERYRSLVEQVLDYGIFMLDEKGRIISWNEGAKRIKGYTAEEILGKYFSIFYTEEDIIKGKPAHELKVAQTSGKYEEEGWRLRKDGSLFWANIVITAVYNNQGQLIGYSKVTRDLTERKESERALRESYDRYRRLAEELEHANAELSYANQELEQFTSIVSHDLQEPIRTIKSFLQLIDMKLEEGSVLEIKNYLGKSQNAANRMRELIHNLLHYAQLSRGDMISQRVDVSELFHQALQNLRTAIEANNAHIQIENEVAFIYGDPVQLVQLVQNLVSNALKFTVSGNPQIRIRCTLENGVVQFSVSDNGIGIAKGDLNKVFEIFKRLSTEKAYPGTGIGLAICKKIVDRHHGRIWPESVPGKGTTFYFTLNEHAQGLQTAS
jgi:PAS domain S-box-containing protein